MNTTQAYQNKIIQQIKNKCLNKILYIHSDAWNGDRYDQIPYASQRSYETEHVIKEMQDEINKYKRKVKKYIEEKNSKD